MVTTHGANPGLVSHFVKQALLNIAKDTGVKVTKPATKAEWGALAKTLGVKTIHIAERDTQVRAASLSTENHSRIKMNTAQAMARRSVLS